MTDPALSAATDRYLDILCQYRPVAGSALGLHDCDGRLDVLDRSSTESESRDLASLARSVEKMAFTATDDEIDRAALAGMISTRLLELDGERQWATNPDRHLEVLLEGIFTIVQRDYAPLDERVASLSSRMREGVTHLERMRASIADPPAVWCESGLASAKAAPAFLDGPVAGAIETLEANASGDEVSLELAREARAASAELRTALQECAGWLEDVLLPGANGTWVAGESVVTRHLRDEHFLADSPDQLISRGEGLIATTVGQLEDLAGSVASEMGLEGDDWREVIDAAKDDHPLADELLGCYERQMEWAREATRTLNLAGRFSDPLAAPLVVEATPEFWRHLIPFAAYSPPGPFDDDQSGFFWVTPPDPDGIRDHGGGAIDLIAIHEGFPGHHLQLAGANRLDRTLRRLAWSTLLVEGWAFYCEEMMWDEGQYDDRVRLMQLKDQLWRACRVVLDIGMHTGQITIDQAVKMLVETAGIEPANAEAEVRRYTSSPTYQICYAIGKSKIVAARERVKAAVGGAFDLSAFHEALLEYGSVPPPLFADALVGQFAPATVGER